MKEDKGLKIFLCIVLSAMIIFTVFSIIIILKYDNRYNRYYEYVDLDNNFIKTWNSSIEIERTIGIDQSNVCLCCNGKRDTVGGYKWKYLDLDYLKSKGDE